MINRKLAHDWLSYDIRLRSYIAYLQRDANRVNNQAALLLKKYREIVFDLLVAELRDNADALIERQINNAKNENTIPLLEGMYEPISPIL